MCSVVLRCYQNVVDVAKGEGEASQHLVHHPLEGLARVPQSKWHADEFNQAKRRDDRRFLHVRRGHRDLMIFLLQIELGEDVAALQAAREVVHPRERILVRLRDEVELPEVTAGPPAAVGLAHHVEGRCSAAVGAANDALLLQVSKGGPRCLILLRIQPAEVGGNWPPLCDELVLHLVCRRR
jgi:hypothetical protein